MQYLKDRIDQLNRDIAPYFGHAKLHGLARLLPVEAGGELPARTLVQDLADDKSELVPDDTYEVWAYHVLTARAF
jgi:hypothetical protein